MTPLPQLRKWGQGRLGAFFPCFHRTSPAGLDRPPPTPIARTLPACPGNLDQAARVSQNACVWQVGEGDPDSLAWHRWCREVLSLLKRFFEAVVLQAFALPIGGRTSQRASYDNLRYAAHKTHSRICRTG